MNQTQQTDREPKKKHAPSLQWIYQDHRYSVLDGVGNLLVDYGIDSKSWDQDRKDLLDAINQSPVEMYVKLMELFIDRMESGEWEGVARLMEIFCASDAPLAWHNTALMDTGVIKSNPDHMIFKTNPISDKTRQRIIDTGHKLLDMYYQKKSGEFFKNSSQ